MIEGQGSVSPKRCRFQEPEEPSLFSLKKPILYGSSFFLAPIPSALFNAGQFILLEPVLGAAGLMVDGAIKSAEQLRNLVYSYRQKDLEEALSSSSFLLSENCKVISNGGQFITTIALLAPATHTAAKVASVGARLFIGPGFALYGFLTVASLLKIRMNYQFLRRIQKSEIQETLNILFSQTAEDLKRRTNKFWSDTVKETVTKEFLEKIAKGDQDSIEIAQELILGVQKASRRNIIKYSTVLVGAILSILAFVALLCLTGPIGVALFLFLTVIAFVIERKWVQNKIFNRIFCEKPIDLSPTNVVEKNNLIPKQLQNSRPGRVQSA